MILSYLTDRVFYVVTEKARSKGRGMKYGVPQGSILVPILFYLLRKRFFPQMPTFLLNSINFLIISMFSGVLYLSLVYHKPRLSYKGICGQKLSHPQFLKKC